ncbi:hypothetical protein HYDPIDRAFT_39574 [Hydnomerulius pinastri MD-312]|nr:hypothetical protein HYDPIDRAFT_39574 [Hydnomerulius pinastri MD-312]
MSPKADTMGLTSAAVSLGSGVNAFSPESLVQQAQAQLDHEIAALRTKRNALSRISRLPPEVLASIFVLYARISHVEHFDEPHMEYFTEVLPWVKVSYVCRQWRDVALSCPTLWTFMFFASQRWTDVLLSRSKSAPLVVAVSLFSPTPRLIAMVEKTLSHMWRVQRLQLVLGRDTFDQLSSKLAAPAPVLQYLSVNGLYYKGDTPVLLDGIFLSKVPHLRIVELDGCRTPWSSPVLSGLTGLKLTHFPRDSQPTMVELLTILRRMPELVDLCLKMRRDVPFDLTTTLVASSQQLVHLLRLSAFTIAGPVNGVLWLLSHLKYPDQTDFRVECTHTKDVANFSDLLQFTAKRFRPVMDTQQPGVHTPQPFVQTLSITSMWNGTAFICSTSEHDFRCRPYGFQIGFSRNWAPQVPLELILDSRRSASSRECGIGDVCRNLSLSQLRSVDVCLVMPSKCSTFWKDNFGRCKALRSIKVDQDIAAHSLVYALSPAPFHHQHACDERTHDWTPAQVFAPVLFEIELNNVEFGKRCVVSEMDDPQTCACSLTCLCDVLTCRKRAGYGVHKLVFNECMYVEREGVEALKKVVGEVVWDGIRRRSPYDPVDFDRDEEHTLTESDSDA